MPHEHNNCYVKSLSLAFWIIGVCIYLEIVLFTNPLHVGCMFLCHTHISWYICTLMLITLTLITLTQYCTSVFASYNAYFRSLIVHLRSEKAFLVWCNAIACWFTRRIYMPTVKVSRSCKILWLRVYDRFQMASTLKGTLANWTVSG